MVTDAGCWEWQGARISTGYGNIWLDGSWWAAHRLMWTIFIGPIRAGMSVLHRCDNPPCCNPDHLFLGTQSDNMADCFAKGRGSNPPRNDGENHHNAKLTEDDVRAIRTRWHGREANQRELAGEYGVTQGAISHLIRGRSWKDVT